MQTKLKKSYYQTYFFFRTVGWTVPEGRKNLRQLLQACHRGQNCTFQGKFEVFP